MTAVSNRKASTTLRHAYRDNDRAVLEILSLAHPACDPDALIDGVEIGGQEILGAPDRPQRGAILLGMHMGNGILMAARLARDGFPIHVVYRDPRRLPPGLLGRSLERAGCIPLALDRANPTRSFRQLLKVLKHGGMVYVLMDQGNKGEGARQRFLGKILRMPTGIPKLAMRANVPVIPIHAKAAAPTWRFQVRPPLSARDDVSLLDAICLSMQHQILERPALWAWHHRRWKRYHLEPDFKPDAQAENNLSCR
ncbi:MAG: lysophospholipid acyltransferase family protein [Wenzhouxiangellaceae bacterium]|nr:lysophospholipid acyltransferase family protein [Wenzhouxiangellaceae bacterium]